MAKRLVLHIGAMKSGTSFIQAVCDHNREALAAVGVLFAGERWRLQVDAVKDLIAIDLGADRPVPEGAWAQLVEEIDAWPGTAVVSMEFLAPRNAEKIAYLAQCFPDTDLQVVLTARDLGRNVPAMWVESMQNRGISTWEEFQEGVLAAHKDSPKWGKWFWRHQAIAEMVSRWQGVVGREHFTLITVPQKGAPKDLLWRRFCEVLGISGESADLEVPSNPSIGAASALVLRELNVRITDAGYNEREYNRRVKGVLAKRGLARVLDDRRSFALDDPWVLKRSQEQIKRLRKLDPRVIGDLDELLAQPVPGVSAVPAEEQLEVALAGMELLLAGWIGESRRLQQRIATLREANR